MTTGTDHVDTTWLASRGIAFASAAGSNAGAVAEYVLACVLLLARKLDLDLPNLGLGVIGVGRIGSRVARWGARLGMRVLGSDPPLQRLTGDPAFLPSAEVISAADILTVHVPLTDRGPDATAGLVDSTDRMAEISVLHALPQAFSGEERKWYRGLAVLDDNVVPVVNHKAFLSSANVFELKALARQLHGAAAV